ncbi:Holliday junction resolvase [Candidatus Woesearchaeota archaeon]|nr:Holliday junction resolvase [Candidatus Woesearchaeota archaeon]
MSLKSKGINAERELIHLFWNNGWTACRVAGSGSTKYPSPDVIAGNNVRKLAIECKVTKDIRQYFTKKEIEELRLFAQMFGAEPWVGVKFNNVDWYFLTLEDLGNKGEGYSTSLANAKTKGFLFDELVKKQADHMTQAIS